ncbi:HK97 family phage prohead protease [Paracoccus sp. S-4012]|uniref:HK97 family phage prohead protease n=1 Tax=Paracoccus sp. S-4012 TaxID=2665648 RepID=UPI0012B0051D|nr:HK97 family phage prohead protease [Paracoccus sp. S-4012]MRX50682.1 HK97 family phage prohead protease [Paracoccus sp. S-4012]
MRLTDWGLETKYAAAAPAPVLTGGRVIDGYASLFGVPDQGGDVVRPGAYAAGLARLAAGAGRVRMLWQHDPAAPIGVWDEIAEDERGLRVKGRLLTEVAQAREAAALIEAGAIEGLSIGYRTIRAERDDKGHRALSEVELWEVSLVTFPMLPEARLAATKAAGEPEAAALAGVFARAAAALRIA